MTRPDGDEHLTIPEACIVGRCSYRTLYRLADRGLLTLLHRPGDRRTYISRRQLERALTPVPATA